MSLPPGVFWCWRQFAGESICVSEELPVAKRGWWCGVDDWDEMRPPAFRHIHGVVPEPGWALKLDALNPVLGCLAHPDADWTMPVGALIGTAYCAVCGVGLMRHARILDRKRLEGKE